MDIRKISSFLETTAAVETLAVTNSLHDFNGAYKIYCSKNWIMNINSNEYIGKLHLDPDFQYMMVGFKDDSKVSPVLAYVQFKHRHTPHYAVLEEAPNVKMQDTYYNEDILIFIRETCASFLDYGHFVATVIPLDTAVIEIHESDLEPAEGIIQPPIPLPLSEIELLQYYETGRKLDAGGDAYMKQHDAIMKARAEKHRIPLSELIRYYEEGKKLDAEGQAYMEQTRHGDVIDDMDSIFEGKAGEYQDIIHDMDKRCCQKKDMDKGLVKKM